MSSPSSPYKEVGVSAKLNLKLKHLKPKYGINCASRKELLLNKLGHKFTYKIEGSRKSRTQICFKCHQPRFIVEGTICAG